MGGDGRFGRVWRGRCFSSWRLYSRAVWCGKCWGFSSAGKPSWSLVVYSLKYRKIYHLITFTGRVIASHDIDFVKAMRSEHTYSLSNGGFYIHRVQLCGISRLFWMLDHVGELQLHMTVVWPKTQFSNRTRPALKSNRKLATLRGEL